MKEIVVMMAIILQAGLFESKAVTHLPIENSNGNKVHIDTADNAELKNWMEGFLSYPDFLHGTEQYVKVGIWIKLRTDGTLLVTNVRTSDHLLKQYIKESINGQYFMSTEKEQDFHFTLSFKEVN